jgi:hypothetical protein
MKPDEVRQHAVRDELEGMVDKVRRAKPHLTEGQAGDHVRSTEAGRRAWESYKGTPGANGVPAPRGDTATTGRAGAQWRSPHSTSDPVTPERTPERPNELPAVKQWNSLKRKFAVDHGFTEERSVEILKLLSQGRAAIDAVIEEARAAVTS